MAKVGSIDINDKMLQQALNAKAEGTTYTGLGDNMLDFGSGSSFLDEDSTGKRFSIKISNAGDADKLLQLNDIIATVEGATVINEGTPVADITVKGSPRPVDILVAYLKKYPTLSNCTAIPDLSSRRAGSAYPFVTMSESGLR